MPSAGPVDVFSDKCEALCGLQCMLDFQVGPAHRSGAQWMQTLQHHEVLRDQVAPVCWDLAEFELCRPMEGW